MGDYDFGQLYGHADNSNVLYAEAWHDAVIEKAAYGRTKDGTKGQWSVTARIAAGENAGVMPLTQTITISHDNPRALGIMFRHLAALGVPVPDPQDPTRIVNGQAPFWAMGWSEEQVAQMMPGRPVQIYIKHEEYDGVTRNKIKDWRPPRPGAPTTWPQPQQVQQQPAQPGWGGQGYQQQAGYMQPPQPQQGFDPYANTYGAQPQAPGWGAPGAPYGQPGQPPQQLPPQQPAWAPAQPQQAPQGYPAQPYGGQGPGGSQPQIPAAPPWAQPGVPGQGGVGEFTPQGQSWQPSHMDPGQMQAPPPMQQPAPFQPPQQAPWQPPAPQGPPAGPPQQGQWQQPQPGQQDPGAPPAPPWAQ